MSHPKPIKRWLLRGFQTYGDAHAYFRGIVNTLIASGFEPGEHLASGTDTHNALRWLLAGDTDTNAEDKTAGGIHHFTLHRPYGFDTSKIGFAVVNNLGETHHFSVRVCLGRAPTRSRVSDAFKAEIEPELENYRKRFSMSYGFCPETGEALIEANLALDYQGPGFKQILETFLLAEGYSQLRDVELDDEGVADRALATRWQAYFAVNAKIIGVSKRGLKIRNERRKQDPFWGMTT